MAVVLGLRGRQIPQSSAWRLGSKWTNGPPITTYRRLEITDGGEVCWRVTDLVFQGWTFAMFTAQTFLIMISPNMWFLFSCTPELTGSHAVPWSHLHHVVTTGCLHKLLVVIYTRTRAKAHYLPVPSASTIPAARQPGTNMHGSLKTCLLRARPSMAPTRFQKLK